MAPANQDNEATPASSEIDEAHSLFHNFLYTRYLMPVFGFIMGAVCSLAVFGICYLNVFEGAALWAVAIPLSMCAFANLAMFFCSLKSLLAGQHAAHAQPQNEEVPAPDRSDPFSPTKGFLSASTQP